MADPGSWDPPFYFKGTLLAANPFVSGGKRMQTGHEPARNPEQGSDPLDSANSDSETTKGNDIENIPLPPDQTNREPVEEPPRPDGEDYPLGDVDNSPKRLVDHDRTSGEDPRF
jgi:hypothetical protein